MYRIQECFFSHLVDHVGGTAVTRQERGISLILLTTFNGWTRTTRGWSASGVGRGRTGTSGVRRTHRFREPRFKLIQWSYGRIGSRGSWPLRQSAAPRRPSGPQWLQPEARSASGQVGSGSLQGACRWLFPGNGERLARLRGSSLEIGEDSIGGSWKSNLRRLLYAQLVIPVSLQVRLCKYPITAGQVLCDHHPCKQQRTHRPSMCI